MNNRWYSFIFLIYPNGTTLCISLLNLIFLHSIVFWKIMHVDTTTSRSFPLTCYIQILKSFTKSQTIEISNLGWLLKILPRVYVHVYVCMYIYLLSFWYIFWYLLENLKKLIISYVTSIFGTCWDILESNKCHFFKKNSLCMP